MSEGKPNKAPTVMEIERRFRSPSVVVARPVVLAGLSMLGTVRRFRWTAQGVAHLLEHDEPLIFASNHASHADTAAILGTLPSAMRRRTCVAAALDVFGSCNNGQKHTLKTLKRELVPFLVAAGFHAFPFDRHGPPLRSLRTAVDMIRRDWNLLLYPEGTRSRSGDMAPFKAGVGVLAKMTGRLVVPIHVSGGRSILPCGVFMPRAGHALVRYGEPMRLSKGESAADFTARVQRRVSALGEEDVAPVQSLNGTTRVGAPTRLAAAAATTVNGSNHSV